MFIQQFTQNDSRNNIVSFVTRYAGHSAA